MCTGGEPALQIDDALISAFKANNIEIAIETNGTVELPNGIDWICVSPKANTEILQQSGNELKLVYPQAGTDPKDFENWKFDHFYLQPMDSPEQASNTTKCIEYCSKNPKWKLSLQTHKYLGIP